MQTSNSYPCFGSIPRQLVCFWASMPTCNRGTGWLKTQRTLQLDDHSSPLPRIAVFAQFLVRRPELIEELKEYGADLVLLDDERAADHVREVTAGGAVRLGLCGLSGEATARLAKLLSPGGKLVSYALMSGNLTVSFNVLDFIFRNISFHGFYQDRREYDAKTPGIIEEAAMLIAEGKLRVPVAAVYPLHQFQEAIAHVQRGGKVLLKVKDST